MKLFAKEYDINTKHFVFYLFGLKISKKDEKGILKASNEYLTNIINSSLGANNIPAAKGEVRQWQLELLEMLKEFDSVCREKQVSYWLDFGTLLGSMRHQGFIPWDDDIDVSMMKDDIEKIMPELKEHFEKLNCNIREKAKKCANYQIRVHKNNYNMGLDIFPMYEYPGTDLNCDTGNNIVFKIKKARTFFEKKYNAKYISKSKIKKAKEDILNIFKKQILPQDDNSQKEILCRGVEFPYEEDYIVMPKNEIFPLREVVFEGEKFYAPNKAEEYLKHLWKNWRDIPNNVGGVYLHYEKDYKNLEEGLK